MAAILRASVSRAISGRMPCSAIPDKFPPHSFANAGRSGRALEQILHLVIVVQFKPRIRTATGGHPVAVGVWLARPHPTVQHRPYR